MRQSQQILSSLSHPSVAIVTSNIEKCQKLSTLLEPLFHDSFVSFVMEGNFEVWEIPAEWREILEEAGFTESDLKVI